MNKQEKKDNVLGPVLKGTLPFVLLAAVILAAAGSHGEWDRFFWKTLPFMLMLAVPFWLFLSIYIAVARPTATVGYAAPDDMDAGIEINPGSGMPTAGGRGAPDVAGNPYGTTR